MVGRTGIHQIFDKKIRGILINQRSFYFQMNCLVEYEKKIYLWGKFFQGHCLKFISQEVNYP